MVEMLVLKSGVTRQQTVEDVLILMEMDGATKEMISHSILIYTQIRMMMELMILQIYSRSTQHKLPTEMVMDLEIIHLEQVQTNSQMMLRSGATLTEMDMETIQTVLHLTHSLPMLLNGLISTVTDMETTLLEDCMICSPRILLSGKMLTETDWETTNLEQMLTRTSTISTMTVTTTLSTSYRVQLRLATQMQTDAWMRMMHSWTMHWNAQTQMVTVLVTMQMLMMTMMSGLTPMKFEQVQTH